MMKKIFMFIFLVIFIVLTSTGNVLAQKVICATEVADLPLQKHEMAAMYNFVDYLEMFGGFNIDFQPGGALGTVDANYQQVGRNQIQFTMTLTAKIAGFDYPNATIFSIPYLFNDPIIARKILDPNSDFFKELSEDMAQKTGIRLLALAPAGSRNLTNSVRPVKNVEDLKGLKIRTMKAPLDVAIWQAAGVEVTPMAFAELYSALQTGVVDGQENPVSIIMSNSFHEVQDYLTMTQHNTSIQGLLVNNEYWETLSEEQKEIVHEASEFWMHTFYTNEFLHKNLGLRDIQNRGLMEVYVPTPEEMEGFKKVMLPAALEFVEEEVDDVSWIEKLMDQVDKSQ